MFDPWQVAATRRLQIYLADLGTLNGVTDGEHVWLHAHLTWTEARCTLTHELEHIDAGHTGHQTPGRERAICERTARRLVPFSRVLAHATSQESLETIADALDVTTGVLTDRVAYASESERAALRQAAII